MSKLHGTLLVHKHPMHAPTIPKPTRSAASGVRLPEDKSGNNPVPVKSRSHVPGEPMRGRNGDDHSVGIHSHPTDGDGFEWPHDSQSSALVNKYFVQSPTMAEGDHLIDICNSIDGDNTADERLQLAFREALERLMRRPSLRPRGTP